MRYLLPVVIGMTLAAGPANAQAVPEWKLSELWRVGGEVEGPHSFDSNQGLGLQPDGGVVHLDWKAKRLYFLDPHGKLLRTVGREGGGPGEFMMPTGLIIQSDGSVVVRDIQNGFIHFSASGRLLDVKPPVGSLAPTGRAWNAVALRDGRLLEVLRLNPSQNGGREGARLLWNAARDRSTELPTALCGATGARPPATIALRASDGKPVGQWPVLFATPWTAAAYSTEGMVWEPVPADGPVLVKHSLRDCNPLATIRLSDQRARIGPDELKLIESNLDAEAKRWRIATPPLDGVPTHQAWYRTLTIDALGNLWVERVVGKDAKEQTEVYSPAGRLVGTIGRALPSVTRISSDVLIGFESDEDGIRYLVAYKIVLAR